MNNNNKQGKKYCLDIDKFFDLAIRKTLHEKNNDSTITEIWQPDENNELKMMNKEMVDTRFDVNNALCSMKFDFLTSLINQILLMYTTEDGNLFIGEDQMSFGQRIAFNTFLKEGVIYEINE